MRTDSSLEWDRGGKDGKMEGLGDILMALILELREKKILEEESKFPDLCIYQLFAAGPHIILKSNSLKE